MNAWVAGSRRLLCAAARRPCGIGLEAKRPIKVQNRLRPPPKSRSQNQHTESLEGRFFSLEQTLRKLRRDKERDGEEPEKQSAEEREQEVSLTERAALLEVRMTPQEIKLLSQQAGATGQDLRLTRQKFIAFSRLQHERDVEREAFLRTIEEPANEGALGRWLLPATGMVGTVSFAVAGVEVAGEAGMNIIGCTFVGCVSSLGGGTVNSLLFGYARHGVPWAADQKWLLVAVVSSLLTFFLWPWALQAMTEERLRQIHAAAQGRAEGAGPEGVTPAEFAAACSDHHFYKRVCAALRHKLKAALPEEPRPSPQQLFALLDLDNNGHLDRSELQLCLPYPRPKPLTSHLQVLSFQFQFLPSQLCFLHSECRTLSSDPIRFSQFRCFGVSVSQGKCED